MRLHAPQDRARSRGARLRLVAGITCLLTSAVPAVTANATEEKGSQLQSFSLHADAPALRVRQGTEQTEGVVPQTLAQLRNGPIGFAQSSTVWPGTLVGNVGSLLVLAADAPKEAAVLDTPMRAEARTGSGPSEVVNEDFPGTTMRAAATADEVIAHTTMGHTATLPAGTVRASRATSRSAVLGPREAVAEASSWVEDISLVDGLVTVESVTSLARATTDGATTKVEGRTVVNDLRVAGQRVTIGSDGITVAEQPGPDTAPAVAAVNEVVKAAKLAIAVGQPGGLQEGGSASWSAGSLVISFTQSSGAVLSVILGGANVSVTGVPGEPLLPLLDLPPAPAGASGPAPAGPVQFDIGTGTDQGGSVALPALPAVPAAAPAPVDLPLVRNVGFALPGPLSPGWLALALLGSVLAASALRKVPDRVVAAGATGPACPLEERP